MSLACSGRAVSSDRFQDLDRSLQAAADRVPERPADGLQPCSVEPGFVALLYLAASTASGISKIALRSVMAAMIPACSLSGGTPSPSSSQGAEFSCRIEPIRIRRRDPSQGTPIPF